MKVRIKPGKISGIVKAPPSKSMAHRLLICAGLSDGISTISNVAESEDILATISCLKALGAEISEAGNSTGEYKTLQIKGWNPGLSDEALLECRESGSTLRFFIPLAALSESEMKLKGSTVLMNRPLSVYEDLFEKQGLVFCRNDNELRIKGRLCGGEYEIPGDISSQFISGLLFALPLCEEESVIRLTGKIESRPYIDMTIQALGFYGVNAKWQGDSSISIPGGQTYRAGDMRVEGDWSNAAYLIALGAGVDGLDEQSLQGDKACVDYFRMLDEACSNLDIRDCPDLGPALMSYAAMNHGCILSGTDRLRIKESDRGFAMKEELAKFGVDVDIGEDSIVVGSGISSPKEILFGHNDHRIVMALAAICSRTGGIIDGAEAVAKSFPNYFEKIAEVGAITEKEY